jgi:hypothetical protein
MAAQIDQPFRFHDLPPELRLMVFENLEFTTTHTLKQLRRHRYNKDGRWKTAGDLTLVVKSLGVSILATCQAINSEATPIMDRHLAQLRSEPLRFVIDVSGIDFDFDWYQEVMGYLAGYMRMLREHQNDRRSQDEPHDLLRAHLIECYRIPISSADSFQHIPISAVDSLWHFIVTATSHILERTPTGLAVAFFRPTQGDSHIPRCCDRELRYATYNATMCARELRLQPVGLALHGWFYPLEIPWFRCCEYRNGIPWLGQVSRAEWRTVWGGLT